MYMHPLLRVSVGVIAVIAAAVSGYLFVDSSVSSWYASLNKPALLPPEWIFPIVGLILYALMIVSVAIIWTKDPETHETEGWVRFFFIQLLFSAAWTAFFFGFHAILISILDLLFLGIVVFGLVCAAWEIDRRVTYFMAPYLAWILFSLYLNINIWLLN